MVFSLNLQSGLGEITSSPPKTDSMTILDTTTSKSSVEILSVNAAQDAAAALNNEESCGLGGDSDTSGHSGISDSLKMEEPKKKHEYTKILPVPLDSGNHAYICPICSDKLDDAHTLTVHIRNHNSKVPSCHSCTICGKTLCSQSSLDRHMLVHSGERPFRCQVCDLSFTTNGNMHRHMRVHEKEFSKSPGSLKALLDASLQPIHGHDSKRSRKRRSASGLNTMVDTFMEKRAKPDQNNTPPLADTHKKKIPTDSMYDDTKVDDGEKLHCPVCQKSFLSKSGLESHIETTHPGCNIRCQLCHLSFPSISLLTAHHAVIHGKPNLPTMNIGFHELAFADFSSGKFPLIAQQWCEENQRRPSSSYHNFECLVCKKAFPTADSLDLHMKVHAKPEYICDVCQLIMPDFDSLKKHKQTVHAARALNFDEPKLEKKEHFLAQLKLHQDKDHSEKDDSDSSDEERDNDYFAKLAELKKDAMKNEVRRSEENNNSSDFADIQKIIQNANVSALPPLSATPTTAPKFADMFKGKAAAAVDDSDDEGVPMVMDYLADDDLSDSLSDITEPSSTVTPTKFNCRFCDHHFDNFNALKVHMRIHQGLSPYKCNMCPYASADKTTLIRHLRTHNGERPFQCKICQYAFTTKANCERHVRKKHNKETKEEIDEAVGYNQQIEETSSVDELQSTVCKYCGVDFKFYRALKHHLRSHASCRQKPFTCSVCEIGFSTKANCIRHIQKRHLEIESHQLEANVKFNFKALDSHSQMSSAVQTPPAAHVSKLHQESALRHLAKFSAPAKMDAPLDFSKKALMESPSAILKTAKKDGDAAEDGTGPIDLSKPGKEKVSKPTSILPNRPVHIHPAFSLSPFMQLNADLLKNPLNTELLNPLFHQTKVFKCPYCHLQFNQESKLHLHMKMHTSTSRPYQCSFCPAGFTVKSNLDIHVRTRHDGVANQTYTPSRNRFVSNNIKLINNLGLNPSSGLTKRPAPFTTPSFLQPKYPTLAGSISKDSQDDLASVSKLLDTTARDTLQSLKLAQASDSTLSDLDKEDKEMVIMEDGQMIEIKKEENQRRDDASTDSGLSPDKTPRKKRNSYANAPNRVSCPYCSRTFPWISSLRRHILTHTGQKPYKCPECPVHFSTKSNRERHLLRKHGVNPINPNTRQIMDRPYKCQLCVFSSFSKPEKLIHHYKTKHPEAEIPSNIHEMNVEMWLTSPNREVMLEEGEDGRLVINEDDYDEDEDEDLDMDESTPEKYSPTPSDDAIIIKGEDSEDEEEELEGEAVMDPEERVTPEPTNRRVLDQYSPSVSPVVRPSPGRTTVINPERDNYNVDKILDCWQCGQHYATRKLLLRHLKEHNTDLPFKCYLCDASYSTRKECLDHKNQRHPDDWVMLKSRNKVENIEEFVVTMERLSEVADEEGANNARIKEVRIGNTDEMTIMAAERKVFCALCPKKFWSLQDLRRHMRSHTGEKPFECDICGRYFTLKHSMMRHRRKHTEADLRPFRSHRSTMMTESPNDTYLGNESNDDTHSPAPDHESFLGIRDRISRTASPVTMTPVAAPVAVATPPVAMPTTPVVKETNPPRSSSPALTSSSLLGLDSSDILHNLLGVDNSAIEQMLQTGSADAAARLLGMN